MLIHISTNIYAHIHIHIGLNIYLYVYISKLTDIKNTAKIVIKNVNITVNLSKRIK